MKKMLLAIIVLCGALTSAYAQAPFKVHTAPKLPVRDALERMNLVTAWNTRVHVDGNRDGVFSVQIIPGPPNQLVVQTFKGAIYLFDADNGDLVWKTDTVGVPFWSPQPAGFNSQSIFVTRRNILFVLNRLDGTQRVYLYNPRIKQADFGYELLSTPSAPLVADEDFLYVLMGDRLHALYIPDFDAVERARKSKEAGGLKGLTKEEKFKIPIEEELPSSSDSPQPVVYWGYRTPNEISDFAPLIDGNQISILTTDGTLTSINRFERGRREEFFEFKVKGRVAAAAGQYNQMAFVASDDYNLYAINMNRGLLAWRHVSGAPILRKPEVNDQAVFISPDRIGLRRLDRDTGREVWTNRDTARFLAANNSYVYALNGVGKFYVLDARRGTSLATYDLSDWTIAMPNEWTDRIYLAANDGQILCMRHRDLTSPLLMKTTGFKLEEKKKPVEKKKEEKKDDKDKEEKKDDKEKAAAKLDRWLIAARQPQFEAAPPFARDGRETWAGR